MLGLNLLLNYRGQKWGEEDRPGEEASEHLRGVAVCLWAWAEKTLTRLESKYLEPVGEDWGGWRKPRLQKALESMDLLNLPVEDRESGVSGRWACLSECAGQTRSRGWWAAGGIGWRAVLMVCQWIHGPEQGDGNEEWTEDTRNMSKQMVHSTCPLIAVQMEGAWPSVKMTSVSGLCHWSCHWPSSWCRMAEKGENKLNVRPLEFDVRA